VARQRGGLGQSCGVAGRVDGAEHIAPAMRPPTRGREHERVGLDAGERLAGFGP
jgi:hypothetical protein